jgi:hypothetical protein
VKRPNLRFQSAEAEVVDFAIRNNELAALAKNYNFLCSPDDVVSLMVKLYAPPHEVDHLH